MPDRELTVGVVITYQNNAASAAADIDAVRTAADEAGQAVTQADQETFDTVQQGAREAADALRGMKDAAGGTGEAAEGAVPKVGKLKDLIQAIRAGSQGDLQGVSSALGRMGEVGEISAGKIGLIGIALSAGYQLGKPLGGLLADILESVTALPGAADDFAASLQAAAKADVEFTGVSAGIDKVMAKYDGLIERAREASRAQEEAAGVADRLEKSSLKLQEKKALAGARSPEEEKAIAAEYGQKRFDIEAAAAIRSADARVKQLTDEQAKRKEQIAAIEEQVLKSEREAKAAVDQYKTQMERLARLGFERAELFSSEGRAQAVAEVEGRRSTAQQAGDQGEADRLTAVLADLNTLPKTIADAAAQQAKSEETTGRLIQTIGGLSEPMRALEQRIGVAQQEAQAVRNEQSAKALDLGGESIGALRGLEQALRDAQNRVTSAVGTGNNTELQAAQQELQRLQTLYSQAAAGVRQAGSDVAAAFTEGAQAASAKAAEAAPQIRAAAESIGLAAAEVGTAGKKAADDITAGAGVVKAAAEAGTGQVAGALREMTDAVTGQVRQLVSIAQQNTRDIATLNGQVSRLSQDVALAVNQSSTALSQLSAQR